MNIWLEFVKDDVDGASGAALGFGGGRHGWLGL